MKNGERGMARTKGTMSHDRPACELNSHAPKRAKQPCPVDAHYADATRDVEVLPKKQITGQKRAAG